MNEELDRRGAEAAADLLAEVTSSETESVLASVRSGATTVGVVASPAQGRRPSTVMLAAAAAVVLLLVGGLWLAMRDDADEIQTVTTSAPSTTLPDTGVAVATTTPDTTATSVAPVTAPPSTAPPSTVPPTTAPPTTVPADPGVELPLDVQRLSVVDASTMWAWGGAIQDNPGPNGHLMRSTDGGTTWTDVGGTDTSTLGAMAFADATNGWIVTAQGLLSTHDGGTTWTPVDLGGAGGETVALAAHGDRVHAVAFGSAGFAVLTSPIGSDDFTSSGLTIQPGAGPAADFSFAWAGDEGWLTYNDRTLISAAHFDGTTWATWDITCDVGPATVWSSGQPGEVDVDCDAGMWGNGTQTELRRSIDGGATFTAIPLPTDLGQYVDIESVLPDGTVVVSGATGDTQGVRVSTDAGATWRDPAWPFALDSLQVADGRWVATGRDAVDGPAGVWVSDDGGARWTQRLASVVLAPELADTGRTCISRASSVEAGPLTIELLPPAECTDDVSGTIRVTNAGSETCTSDVMAVVPGGRMLFSSDSGSGGASGSWGPMPDSMGEATGIIEYPPGTREWPVNLPGLPTGTGSWTFIPNVQCGDQSLEPTLDLHVTR